MTVVKKSSLVTTFSGKRVKRILCRQIKGSYYLVGNPKIKDSGECYLVEGRYHRFNNGLIEYDYEKEVYVLNSKHRLKFGIVDIDTQEEPVKGFFSTNLSKNVILVQEDGERIECISEEVAKVLKYREKFKDGLFYPRSSEKKVAFNRITNPPINKRNLPYDSRFASNITKDTYNNHFNPKFNSRNLNAIGDFLEKNGITFGVEFETSKGYIPDRLCYKYGLIALRDGSITGLEYVTIPYSGRKGVYALREVCRELSKRTKHDFTCSIHIHVGGLKRAVEDITSAAKLAYIIQDDIMSLQPPYKSGKYSIEGKSKNYCGLLPKELKREFEDYLKVGDVESAFDNLFRFFSDGRNFKSNYNRNLDEVKCHPSDPNGTGKWNISSRYHWLNFVPIMFGNKKTLEFRQHSITFDFEKILNFLLTCGVFIHVASTYKKDLLNPKSELVKELNKSKTPVDVMLSKFPKSLVDNEIFRRIVEYNSIRRGIMSTLLKNEDYAGVSENKYENLYSKLEKGFWD